MRSSGSTHNSALKTEHGLSLHVRHNQKEILIDCGGSDGFLKNAGTLGIDISQIDFGILTHHYDHGGGLSAFLEQNAQRDQRISKAVAEISDR